MKKYSIGIDLGGTRVKIGLVSEGEVVAKKIIPANADQGLAASLPILEREIDGLLQGQDVKGRSFAGVGLAFAGLVDPRSKKILSTNKKYDDALSVDLEGWVHRRWDRPFFIDNDARMAAVGEWKYGAGRDTDDLVVMTIGTGIGTSAIIGGKLLRGRHFQAGCLGGHMTVQYNGRVCTCGNIGCVEAYGSTWSLEETVRQSPDYAGSLLAATPANGATVNEVNANGGPAGGMAAIGFSGVFEAADRGDELAARILRDCLDVWSAGIVNLIHAYDPEVVVLGGGVLNRASAILPYITEKVTRHAWCPWGQVQIRASQLLSDAGILGVVHCLGSEI